MEQRPFAEELAAFPIVVRWPVQWGDQDAFQHVNNTIYFRWFDLAATGVQLGWVLDPLTAIMLVMVTFLALLI